MIEMKQVQKAVLLKALWELAPVKVPVSSTLDLPTAERLVAENPKITMVLGRTVPVDLSGDTFDETAYDALVGAGAAARAYKAAEAFQAVIIGTTDDVLMPLYEAASRWEKEYGIPQGVGCFLFAQALRSNPKDFAESLKAALAFTFKNAERLGRSTDAEQQKLKSALLDLGRVMEKLLPRIRETGGALAFTHITF